MLVLSVAAILTPNGVIILAIRARVGRTINSDISNNPVFTKNQVRNYCTENKNKTKYIFGNLKQVQGTPVIYSPSHHYSVIKINALFLFQKIEPEPEVTEKKDCDYKPHGIISRQKIKPPNEKFSRRSKRFAGQDENGSPVKVECKDECDSDNEQKPSPTTNGKNKSPIKAEVSDKDAKENSKELKKLQFYGAGPKMAGYQKNEKKPSNKTRGLKLNYDFDPVSIISMINFVASILNHCC